MQRTVRKALAPLGLTFSLVGALLMGAGTGTISAGAQAAPAGPTVTGTACAPGVGVTVVVDTGSLGDGDEGDITIGCAPGQQTNGLTALTGAGFAIDENSPFLCQIDGFPVEGQPYCMNQGFWSYLKSDGSTPWTSSQTGPAAGPLPIDSVEGWAWTSPLPGPPDYAGNVPRIAVADLPVEDTTTTTTSTSTSTTSTTMATTTTTTPPGSACSTELSGDGGADAALDWLACELEANGGTMPGFAPGSPDYGLTIDAVLAFTTNDRGNDPAAVEAAGIIEDDLARYVTDVDFGDGNERYSGALGKSLLMAGLRGENVDDFGGFDLDDEVLARMQTTGADTGRFSDLSQYGDYSNGFGQTLSIMGLSYTDAGVPTAAVDFLLDQQCPGGGFRGSYGEGDGGCADDASADTDYTGLSIQALLSVPSDADVDAAIEGAVTWLVDRQAGDGSLGGSGITGGPNTNSAGFAAQALRATGEGAAADAAATWIRSLQLQGANTDVTTNAAGPGSEDVGAIAYDQAGFDTAIASGIPAGSRDQFRRASAQAALAFSAPTFGAPRPVDPMDPTEPTQPVGPTDPTDPAVPGPTDPNVGNGPSNGNDSNDGGVGNDGVPASTTGSLPRTGATVWPTVFAGLVLLLGGAALLIAARRRTLLAAQAR